MATLQQYTIVVERAEAGENWCGYSPDVAGVIATDITAEAIVERLRGANELHLKVTLDEGMSLPEPSTPVRMTGITV